MLALGDERAREESVDAGEKSFTELFYANKRRMAPKVKKMRERTQTKYRGDNEQMKACLANTETRRLQPEEMKKISTEMREVLGLLDASVPSDPSDIADYRAFLTGKKGLGLDVDESAIDPVLSVEQMTTHFMNTMDSEGSLTHVMEPQPFATTVLQTLVPIASGAFMGALAYVGTLKSATLLDNAWGKLLEDNVYTLSLNVVFVAVKTVKSMMENDYGNWQTLAASPLELMRRLAPTITGEAIDYMLGAVILGPTGLILGCAIFVAKIGAGWLVQKGIQLVVKKILINKDAFEDMMMEQTTNDEMIEKMHAEMVAEAEESATTSVYRMPLLFKALIKDEQVRTIAMCATILAPGILVSDPWGWSDWIIDALVVKWFLNPAMAKLLSRTLASKWLSSVTAHAWSKSWRLAKQRLPKWSYERLEKYAHHYMWYHHACQVIGVLIQMGPLIVVNQTVTLGGMRAGLVDLIEWRYMPQLNNIITTPTSVESPMAVEYLDQPSNTFRVANLQRQQMERGIQRDSIRQGRSRLWGIDEGGFKKLTAEERSYMSVAMGEGVHRDGINFSDVVNFRDRAWLSTGILEGRFLKTGEQYTTDLFKAEEALQKQRGLCKSIMRAELEMVEKYGMSLDQLRRMKNTWPVGTINEFSMMYEIDHGDDSNAHKIKFHTARLSKKYADMSEADFTNLPERSADAPSMQQFVQFVYEGGSFMRLSVSMEEFQKWQKTMKEGEEYKRWGDVVKWHDFMLDTTKQHDRLMGEMSRKVPVTGPGIGAKVPSMPGAASENTVSNTIKNLGPGEAILPAAAGQTQTTTTIGKLGQGLKQPVGAKVGEAFVSASMKQAVTFATSNQLGNIKSLVHMMFFGGLDAVIRLFSGIEGGKEDSLPQTDLGAMPSALEQLEKISPQGLSKCLLSTGKWHLSMDVNGAQVPVDEKGTPVDGQCYMQPVLGASIRFAILTMINAIVGAATILSGPGGWIMSTLLAPVISGLATVGVAGSRRLFIQKCMDKAERLGCDTTLKAIPEMGTADYDKMVMCHFNNVLLNIACSYIPNLLGPDVGCENLAMYTDVRELGLSATGVVSDVAKFTADMTRTTIRISQIGTTWRSYLDIPGSMKEVMGNFISIIFDAPEHLWPLIVGSRDISTGRYSFEQIQRERKKNGVRGAYLVEQWFFI